MKRFEEYNHLLYGRPIGWRNGEQVIDRSLSPQEYDLLLSLLNHRKVRLRWSAANRLGQLRDRRAVQPLIAALRDPHWLVRLHAAKALGRVRDRRAIQPLIEALGDERAFVRRRVVAALAALNKPRRSKVTEALVTALADPDKQVRATAAGCLGDITSSFVLVALVTAVQDKDENVSWRAIDALEKIGAPSEPYLISLLDHPDREVRYRAVKTLGRIGSRQAIDSLEERLDDPDERVRWRAGFALNQIRRSLF